MKYSPLFILLVLFSTKLHAAGEAKGAKVVDVRVDRNGYGLVGFDRPLVNPASCMRNHPHHLSFNVNTEGGKGILSIVLSAQATGNPVWAWGSGTCDIYGVVESWSHGWVHRK